jgi:ATP-binding cassette, subfamily C, bacterial
MLEKLKRKKNRVRTPTLLQMEAVECGAAALGIILSYYDRIVPLTQLRVDCGVSRNGSNAFNLLKAAESYGLKVKALNLYVDSLRNLPPPFIIFWNFNHFLVVEGLDRNKVYLNDPASGRRTVSLQEFGKAYTGVVLTMQPGENFQKGGQKQSVVIALVSRLRGSKGILLYCLVAGLFLTFCRLTVPVFAQVFVDEILVSNRENWLRPLVLGMFFTAILRGFLAWLRLTYLRKLLLKLSATLSGQFLWHILRLPIGFYAQRFVGEISNRVSLNEKVAEILSGRLATTVIDGVMMVVYFAIMLLYDWVLTGVVVIFALINFLALQILSRTRIDANLQLVQEYGKVSGIAISGVQTIETIKASGIESDFFTKFAGYYAKALNAQQQLALQTQILTALPTFLSALATASILIVGGLRVINGNLSLGMLVAYQSLSTSFLFPIDRLVNFGSLLQDLAADLNRLDDVLHNSLDEEIEREKKNSSQLSIPFRLQGHIELRNVTFGYSRVDAPLIKNFSLTIEPGQRIAIVGGSGSGKSTIAKLICGLYQPRSGEIFFDGIPRQQIPRSVLAESLAMVEQDIFIFAGGVKENLTLWDSTISQEDLVRACQDAVIDDSILSLPGGYNARLIEGGINLSGGQRQRLEIARALVRNPTILVLDEATSALDGQTESQINHNLKQRGCSCIVIAHRLNTIRDCDRVVTLDNGLFK